MSFMQDKIYTLSDLGRQVKAVRQASDLGTVEIADRSGRSRDVLYRLEQGRDVSVSSLLALLQVLGHAIEIVPAGRPTLEEMRRRFAFDEEDEPGGGA